MEEKKSSIRKAVLFLVGVACVIALSISMIGCTANQHLKKSKRHYEKAIRKGYIPQADTVYVIDTLIRTEVRRDTTFLDKVGDTIIIQKERLKLKYIRFADSVFIEGVCLPDTVVKRVPIIVNEKVYIEKSILESLGITKWWHKIFLVLIILSILLLFKFR